MTDTTTDLVPARPSAAAVDLRARMDFAAAVAQAGNLPRNYQRQPANLLLADQYARDLALPFTTILTDIHVIEGKPAASAGLISALVRRAGHKLRTTLQRDENGNPISATATIIRHDDPEFPFVVTFTLADAARANLCQLRDGRPYARSDRGKVLPWEAYPGALLKARAVSACARDACQEALLGVQYTPEELGAVVDEEGQPVEGPTVRPEPVAYTPPTPPEPERVVEEIEVVDETTGEVPADDEWPAYDDEPTPPAAAARPASAISKAQLGKLGAMFSERGITGRDEALAIVAEAIGRRVDSRSDLTKAEASRLIDYLDNGGQAA